MPPKRRSLPAVHNSNLQSNKRASDTPLPDSGKRRKHADVNNKELRRDSYCWVCHQLGHDIECKKDNCQRVYHTVCLDNKFKKFIGGVCPECQQHKSKNKFLTVDNLRDILEVAVKEFRKKFKSPDKMMFYQWPNIESSELVRIIDLDLLEDNIKDTQNPYKSLAGFISDLKWIHHNYCILDGVDSPTAKEAEGFVRTFQKEILDIEDCPMCYYNMLVPHDGRKGNFFLKLCDPPHDVIWAKLKGSPHWPAKCLRVVNGKAHVRFFFTHDKSNITLDTKKCLSMSLFHPEHKASRITDDNLIPKKVEYKAAVDELLNYIKLYERKSGKKFKFAPAGTPYKCDAVKPIRKKKKMVCPKRVSLVRNSEGSVHTPPPSSGGVTNGTKDTNVSIEDKSVPSLQIDASHLRDQHEEVLNVSNKQTEGNLSATIEEATRASEENTDRAEFVTLDSSSLFERVNKIDASTSPVLSASMICEVAGSSETQTAYIDPLPTQAEFSQLNLPTDTSIATSSFQPLITCTSTPVMTASTSLGNFANQWNMSLSRTHNLLTDTVASFQEQLSSYSESQQLLSDSESLATESNESVPLDIGPSTSSGIPNQDDDVVFISANRRARNSGLNPSAVLPYIFSGSPDLQGLFKDGRFVFDSLFIRCWAFANRCPQAPEIISSLILQMKQLHSEKQRLIKDKKALVQKKRIEEERVHREEYIKLQENFDNLKTQLDDMTTELEKAKSDMALTTDNAQGLIRKLHRQYQKSLEIREKEILLEKDEMLQERDSKISVMYDTISKLKEDIGELKAKHAETVESYSMKLEDILKTQKEKISLETKQEIKDMIVQHLNEIKLAQKSEASSSVIENHERNLPSVSSDEKNCGAKKSIRRSPPKTERVYYRPPIEAETTAATINQHFYQQQEIQTVARKTSVGVQLERTLKTTTTTRNEGKVFGYSPPIYGHPFDPSTSAGHSPFNLPHISHHDMHSQNLISNLHAREGHNKDSRKRQSRFTD